MSILNIGQACASREEVVSALTEAVWHTYGGDDYRQNIAQHAVLAVARHHSRALAHWLACNPFLEKEVGDDDLRHNLHHVVIMAGFRALMQLPPEVRDLQQNAGAKPGRPVPSGQQPDFVVAGL